MTKSPPSFQLSKEMTKLTQSIVNNSRNTENDKNHEAQESSVEQDAEQNNLKGGGGIIEEESPVKSDEKNKSSDSAKTDEGFIVGILKALIKMLGGKIDEDGKEEEKNKSNALDELRKLIFGDNSKGKVVESASVTLLPDLQNKNLKDSEDQTQAQDLDQALNQNPTQDPARASTQDPAKTLNSIPDQNGEKGENNADKLITQLIVGLYEKEGKLNILKEILNDERGKNEDNLEMQNLINGFDSQIAEVEKGREQAADKDEKGVKNSEEVEVEPKFEGAEVKPEEAVNQNSVNKVIDNASESKSADNKESDQPEKKSEQGLEDMGGVDNKLVDFKEGDLTDLDAIVKRFNKSGVVAEDMNPKDSVEPTAAISEEVAKKNEQGQER